jgi:hypothetical protein
MAIGFELIVCWLFIVFTMSSECIRIMLFLSLILFKE